MVFNSARELKGNFLRIIISINFYFVSGEQFFFFAMSFSFNIYLIVLSSYPLSGLLHELIIGLLCTTLCSWNFKDKGMLEAMYYNLFFVRKAPAKAPCSVMR